MLCGSIHNSAVPGEAATAADASSAGDVTVTVTHEERKKFTIESENTKLEKSTTTGTKIPGIQTVKAGWCIPQKDRLESSRSSNFTVRCYCIQ
jgi:hypothetical protein